MKTKHSSLKDKEFQKKKHEHEEKNQLPSNVYAQWASFLVVNHCVKAQLFTISEEQIFTAIKDVSLKLWRNTAVQKVTHAPLLTSAKTRQID